jgi:hypothetical protein
MKFSYCLIYRALVIPFGILQLWKRTGLPVFHDRARQKTGTTDQITGVYQFPADFSGICLPGCTDDEWQQYL